jgi:hypothetical protein
MDGAVGAGTGTAVGWLWKASGVRYEDGLMSADSVPARSGRARLRLAMRMVSFGFGGARRRRRPHDREAKAAFPSEKICGTVDPCV